MKFLKPVIFIIGLLIVFNIISFILIDRTDDAYLRREAFSLLEPNSIELMFIGNSHSFCTFDPKVIEKTTGLKTYNAAMPSQLLDMAFYNLKYQLKTQNPKVIVLEAFTFQGPTQRDVFNDSNILSMDPSSAKFSAIFNIFSKSSDRFELMSEMYRNHINWSNKTVIKDNLKRILRMHQNPYIENKGLYQLDSSMSSDTISKFKNMPVSEATYKARVSEYDTKYFNKIAEECKIHNIKLIMTMAPMNKYFIEKVDYQNIYNDFKKLCVEKDVEYIDYNILYEKLNLSDLDFEDAFHNAQHINKSGAQKVSTYIGEYLSNLLENQS